MFNFIKQIFTWWHKQTFGTFIYTLFKGKLVGKDQFGNSYYQSKNNKRWVIYKNEIEASYIPPEWYMWIHHLKKNLPKENKKYDWQKTHTGNLTGTPKAFRPKGSLVSDIIKENKKYETWKN